MTYDVKIIRFLKQSLAQRLVKVSERQLAGRHPGMTGKAALDVSHSHPCCIATMTHMQSSALTHLQLASSTNHAAADKREEEEQTCCKLRLSLRGVLPTLFRRPRPDPLTALTRGLGPRVGTPPTGVTGAL